METYNNYKDLSNDTAKAILIIGIIMTLIPAFFLVFALVSFGEDVLMGIFGLFLVFITGGVPFTLILSGYVKMWCRNGYFLASLLFYIFIIFAWIH